MNPSIPATMRALVIEGVTPANKAQISRVNVPKETPGRVLIEGLHLERGDTLLVRGATCALGAAAIQLARTAGARVFATTHREEHLEELEALLGKEDRAVYDCGKLAGKLDGEGITKTLELIGPATLADSMRCLQPGGICCNTGILGGVEELNGFDPITDIPNGCYLTGFYSNYPNEATMSNIFAFLLEHDLRPSVGAEFGFDHMPDALALQDAGGACGKIVVTM